MDSAKLRLQMILLDANSGNPQAIEQIMNMSTNLPWYKCWCKDGTEFYNNMSQIERDYISLFPNKLLELLDRLLYIVEAQRYIDELVEGKKQLELLPHTILMPQLPTDFLVDAYKVEEVLMLLDEIMKYIENDSEIRLRKRELKFFNERNVCPSIGHSCDKNDANI